MNDERTQSYDTQLLEEGAAFAELSRRERAADADARASAAERHDVVVIGGGQAGLSVGYHLKRLGLSFVILDERARVGDAWRERWDSLNLFTPRRYDALDGLRFPGVQNDFPTKDEMADYLAAYAKHFDLPIRNGARVERLTREGDTYVVTVAGRRIEAGQVVIAMSSYQRPITPAFASQLDPSIVQMHSVDYRNPAQLPDGDVLVVGAANSGAEIAIDLVRSGRRVWISGRHVGEVPFDVRKAAVRRFIMPILFRVVFHRVLTVDTPMGRKARPGFTQGGTVLIRTRARDLKAAGVEWVPRVAGVENGKPRLADGRVLDARGVVWSTGFDLGRSWIQLPVFDDRGEPVQSRGVVPDEPGLYFVGPHFLYSASSTMIHGIGRDAQRVAQKVAERAGSRVSR